MPIWIPSISHIYCINEHLLSQVPVPLELSCHDNTVNGSYQHHPSAQLERSHNHTKDPTSPEQVQTPNGPVLTAYGKGIIINVIFCSSLLFLYPLKDEWPTGRNFVTGRQQLRCGLRRRDLKYEGDPDLRPISSYEVVFLVRWLYSLSLLLNTKVSEGGREL